MTKCRDMDNDLSEEKLTSDPVDPETRWTMFLLQGGHDQITTASLAVECRYRRPRHPAIQRRVPVSEEHCRSMQWLQQRERGSQFGRVHGEGWFYYQEEGN